MNKRIAVIDCGTNTFNLLIADILPDGPDIIFSTKTPVRIGKGGLNNGFILPDAEERAISALKAHKNTADSYHVSHIYCFATSAFRNAENGQQIADRVLNETSIQLRIISGIDEAMLIYEGVKASGAIGDENALIMDIGGGSCEFIYANQHIFHHAQSFEIGVSRLFDRFPMSNPPKQKEIDQVYNYLDNILQELYAKIPADGPKILIGSSGTFDTFKDMYIAAHPTISHSANFLDISKEVYQSMFHQICESTLQERLQIPGMSAFRAEMMVASVISVKTIMNHFNFPSIRTCAYSMKEGILQKVWKDAISE